MLPYLMMSIPFLLVLLMAYACGSAAFPEGLGVWAFMQKTFVPMTKRDFWLPPCPLCWLVRAAVVVVAIYAANDYLAPTL